MSLYLFYRLFLYVLIFCLLRLPVMIKVLSYLWPPYVIGQAIIFSSCGFFFLSFFFPRLISAVGDWISTILPHMVWPYCKFRMQVWNVLRTARWKYSTQKIAKKSPSGHHPTTLSGYIFAIKAYIDNRKKIVKQRCVLHMSLQYGELRPTNGWDPSGSLRHPCEFQRISRLGSVKAKFHYASWFEAGRRQFRSQIPLRYLVRTSLEPAPNQIA